MVEEKKTQEKSHWKFVSISLVSMETNGTNRYFHYAIVTEKVWELSTAQHISDHHETTSFHGTLKPFGRLPQMVSSMSTSSP